MVLIFLITVSYEFNGWLYKEGKDDLDSFNLSLKEFFFFQPRSGLNDPLKDR